MPQLDRDPGFCSIDFPSDEHWERLSAQVREDVERSRRRAAHYASLKRKYKHTARYPWRSVEADPPEPY